jgi:hypothetical protein
MSFRRFNHFAGPPNEESTGREIPLSWFFLEDASPTEGGDAEYLGKPGFDPGKV